MLLGDWIYGSGDVYVDILDIVGHADAKDVFLPHLVALYITKLCLIAKHEGKRITESGLWLADCVTHIGRFVVGDESDTGRIAEQERQVKRYYHVSYAQNALVRTRGAVNVYRMLLHWRR